MSAVAPAVREIEARSKNKARQLEKYRREPRSTSTGVT